MRHRPRKRFGQHFLTDPTVADRIVAAAAMPDDDGRPRLVIEIGPGPGILTEGLLDGADAYAGIEIDRDLARDLRERFGGRPDFDLVEDDILKVDLPALIDRYPGHRTVVVGNIPYNITSPILFRLFDHADRLHGAVLMMQREVADRLVAAPRTKAWGLLTIHTELFAEAETVCKVGARQFHPPPKVDSTVLRLRFRHGVREGFADFELFRRVVRHCFHMRRKMMRNSLSGLFSPDLIAKLSADLTRRPEELSVDEWRRLTDTIHHLRLKEAEE